MKQTLLIMTVMLFVTLTVKGQNLFLFGDKSYPCTETITLQSNSASNNLNLLFGKDGTKALIGVSIKLKFMIEQAFTGNLIVYLDDGTVITCEDQGKHDFVNNATSAIYYLSNEQLNKMKNSNINTVRYTLKSSDGYSFSPDAGNFSASNKGRSATTDFPTVLTNFYMNFNSTYDNSEVTAAEQSSRSSDAGTFYDLAGRRILSLPDPKYDSQITGVVVVAITVDPDGRVTEAVPGIKGSTTLDEHLLKVSRDAANQARFEPNPDAPAVQKGTITYNFLLK